MTVWISPPPDDDLLRGPDEPRPARETPRACLAPLTLPWWGWMILGAAALALGIIAAEATAGGLAAQAARGAVEW